MVAGGLELHTLRVNIETLVALWHLQLHISHFYLHKNVDPTALTAQRTVRHERSGSHGCLAWSGNGTCAHRGRAHV